MFVLATIGCAAAPSIPVLVAARAVLGLAVGASSVVVPVFLAELAPVYLRGRLVAQNELMLVGGQALAFVFNAGLATAFGHVAHVWRYMLVLATVPALALWIGMTVVPESPRWLAGRGRAEEARRALHRIREDAYSPREAEHVLELAARDGDRDRDRPRAGLLDLVRIPWIRRVFVLGLSMAVINEISGINAVQHYGVSVLQDSGFGGNGAFYANIVPRPRGGRGSGAVHGAAAARGHGRVRVAAVDDDLRGGADAPAAHERPGRGVDGAGFRGTAARGPGVGAPGGSGDQGPESGRTRTALSRGVGV